MIITIAIVTAMMTAAQKVYTLECFRSSNSSSESCRPAAIISSICLGVIFWASGLGSDPVNDAEVKKLLMDLFWSSGSLSRNLVGNGNDESSPGPSVSGSAGVSGFSRFFGRFFVLIIQCARPRVSEGANCAQARTAGVTITADSSLVHASAGRAKRTEQGRNRTPSLLYGD